MLTKLTPLIHKFTTTKLWYYIENVLVVGLLFYCIKFLTDYDNVYYQTWKNEVASKAILAFTAIIFIIRKVKLLNWQSLIATLLFGAVVYERMHFWADAEDILNAIKPQMAAEWLSLMIVIDMILYKNVNDLCKGKNYLFILYILMTVGMIWRRHDRMDPIVLIFPMLLFALVKMDEERTDWFIRRFIDGWFITYIYVMAKSFTEHPYEGSRYYGCFLNIGQFGIFMVCSFTMAIATIYYCKVKYGRKNFGYLFGIIWLISLSYMFYIIDTRTQLLGVIVCILFLFFFARKKVDKKHILFRFLFILFVSILVITCGILFLNYSKNISDGWIWGYKVGLLSPLSLFAYRMKNISIAISDLPIDQKVITFLNMFSSGRLEIIKGYSEYFNYDGNPAIGFELASSSYWVYTAHNTYIQYLVEYGYVSFIELIIIIVMSIYRSVNNFINNKSKPKFIFPMLWFASMIGVWFGESNTFFFPITFFGFMFIARLLPQEEK